MESEPTCKTILCILSHTLADAWSNSFFPPDTYWNALHHRTDLFSIKMNFFLNEVACGIKGNIHDNKILQERRYYLNAKSYFVILLNPTVSHVTHKISLWSMHFVWKPNNPMDFFLPIVGTDLVAIGEIMGCNVYILWQHFYLSDHRKAHDEKGDTASKSKQRLVST